MSFNLDGYITVNERMIAFFDKYPAGSIQTRPAEIVTIEDKTFIRIIAEVYRTSDDQRPGIGEAWEVFPGKTPYTKDSEAMNAGTSAIGRAILAVGVGFSDAGVASADEVRVAQERRAAAPVTQPKNQRFSGPSEKQTESINRMMAAIPLADRARFLQAVVGFDAVEQFDRKAIDWFFETKTAGVAERYTALKAVWGDQPTEDDPWAVEKW